MGKRYRMGRRSPVGRTSMLADGRVALVALAHRDME